MFFILFRCMKSLLTIETKQQKKSSERNKQLINIEKKLKQTQRKKNIF